MEGRSKGNKTGYAGIEEKWEGKEAIRNITLPLPTIQKKNNPTLEEAHVLSFPLCQPEL